MEHVAIHRLDLLVVHRPVGGAEVNRALGELADAATGPDGLVVDAHAGRLGVRVEPLGVDRIGEGGAGAGEGGAPAGSAGGTRGAGGVRGCGGPVASAAAAGGDQTER